MDAIKDKIGSRLVWYCTNAPFIFDSVMNLCNNMNPPSSRSLLRNSIHQLSAQLWDFVRQKNIAKV